MRTRSRGKRLGSRLLRDWLVASGKRQSDLAKAVGVSQGTLSRWLSGDLVPDAHNQDILEKLTGVARSAWWTAKERRKFEAASIDAAASGEAA